MKRLLATLAGVALVAAGALGQTSGGYPSRPTFQSLVVSGTTALGNTVTTAQGLQVKGAGTSGFAGAGTELFNTGTAGGLQAYNRSSTLFIPLQFSGSTLALTYGQSQAHAVDINATGNVALAAPSSGYALQTTAPAGSLFTAGAAQFNAPNTAGQSNGVRIIAGTNSTDAQLTLTNAANTQNLWNFLGDGSLVSQAQTSQGNGTINAAALYQGAVRVPRISSGNMGGASTCTITNPVNVAATCTWNSLGYYQVFVTPSNFASTAPTCTVTTTGTSPTVGANFSAASTLIFKIYNLSGALVDNFFSFICVGT